MSLYYMGYKELYKCNVLSYYTKKITDTNDTTHIPLHKNTALSLYIDFIPIIPNKLISCNLADFTEYFFQV